MVVPLHAVDYAGLSTEPVNSIQHEQSYFEVGLGFQLSLDWNGIGKTNVRLPCRTLRTHICLKPGGPQ